MSTPPEGPEGPERTVDRLRQTLTIPYRHTVAHALARFLAGLKEQRLLGLHCPVCNRVLCPPAAVCPTCFARTDYWVELPPTATVKGFSVVHITFPGQPVPPPFVYAELVVDGAATVLVHRVGEVDFDRPDAGVRMGQRVEVVWATERVGSLLDIEYFRPVA